MKYIMVLVIFVHSVFALTKKQIDILQTIRDVAKSVPDKRGVTFENTLSAICLVESNAGKKLIGDVKKNVPITKASLGILQIQPPTARFIATKFKRLKFILKMSNYELVNKLVTNIKFSALVAAHYLVWLRNTRKTYYYAVSGYNGGYRNWRYYKRVKRKLKVIKSYVKRGLLR